MMNHTKRIRHKTRKIKKTLVNNALKTSYGVVILPKGMRLYHCSADNLCTLPEKPLIFMTLHPSEWYHEDNYISVIELQRDVNLLFMISNLYRIRIISALNDLLDKSESNLNKKYPNKIKTWLPYLEKEGFDGWFSSIENKLTIEFAVKNDPSILKIIECDKISMNWKNSYYSKELQYIPKNWGNQYPISPMLKSVKFILNGRFQQQLETFKKEIEDMDPSGYAFTLLLKNSEFKFFNAPLKTIHWS